MTISLSIRWVSRKALLLSLSIAATALTGGHAGAKDLTEVVFGLPANARVSYAYFTAAMELGYYEQEGLNVKLQEFQGGALAMLQVSTKSITFAAATGDPLVTANQPGKTRLPIKFFYNQTRAYNWEFVVPPNSAIQNIADLKGKTLGVGALTNSHMPVTRLVMKENGLEGTKDYRTIAIGDGGPAFKALMDGQVDAFNTSTTNIAGFEAFGTKLRRLSISPRFQALFQQGFLAHEDTIKQRPELIYGFGRATTKATIACQTSIEWCIKNFWKYYPNLRPREGTPDENAHRLAESVQSAWKSLFVFQAGQPRHFAEFPDGAWQNLIDILYEGGEISTNKVDPSIFYTNELVAKINDFDEADVVKRAQGLK